MKYTNSSNRPDSEVVNRPDSEVGKILDCIVTEINKFMLLFSENVSYFTVMRV